MQKDEDFLPEKKDSTEVETSEAETSENMGFVEVQAPKRRRRNPIRRKEKAKSNSQLTPQNILKKLREDKTKADSAKERMRKIESEQTFIGPKRNEILLNKCKLILETRVELPKILKNDTKFLEEFNFQADDEDV